MSRVSLSKTTKLFLLDSLLQEVCIESGSDGSLALSSLGLSVCLVSHNLLYSGLKKAHSTIDKKKTRKDKHPCVDGCLWEQTKKSTAFCIPRRSPIQVLTGLNLA